MDDRCLQVFKSRQQLLSQSADLRTTEKAALNYYGSVPLNGQLCYVGAYVHIVCVYAEGLGCQVLVKTPARPQVSFTFEIMALQYTEVMREREHP